MVIIEARTLVARFQTHLLSRVFVQMRGSHLVVSAVPTAPSLHTSVSAWNGTGICICKAWAEPQSGHTRAIAPVSGLYSLEHLLPCAVSLNPNTAASPIFYPLLVWTRSMAHGCPTTTTSSLLLLFILSCLIISHDFCNHGRHGRPSGCFPLTNSELVIPLFLAWDPFSSC